MAISDGNDHGTQPSAGTATQDQKNEGEALRLIGATRGSDFERNERLLEATKQWVEKKGLKDRVHVFPMAASRYNLRTSGVVIATEKRVDSGRMVFYAVLYTETQELKNFNIPRQLPSTGFGGQPTNFEFPVTMYDIMHATGQGAARECVKDQFPDVDKLYFAHHFPVLLEAQVDGKNADPSTMDELMFDVSDALDSKMEVVAKQYQKNAQARVAQWKNKLITLKTETNPQAVCDVNGIPVRSDLSFVMTAQDPNVQNNNPLKARPQQIARADAYIQPMYLQKPRAEAMMQGMMPHMNPALMHTYFVPEVHITNIQPQDNSNSLEDIILSLMSVTSISDNALPVLTAAFAPRKTSGPVNFRNIGALSLDVPHVIENPDQKAPRDGRFVLDTASEHFQRDPRAMMDLLNKLFAMSPIYMLHVPEAGELTYRTHAFLEATQSNDVGSAAKREIINALDNLTDGKFSSEYWKNEKAPIATLSNYRLPNGYFEADDGVAYDLRRIDTLALKNIEGMSNDDSSNEWTDALYNESLPTAVREMKLLRVLRHHVPGMRVTGMSHVLILDPEFLNAARNALLAGGLVNVQLQSNLQAVNDTRARGLAGGDRYAAVFNNRFAAQGSSFSAPAGGQGFGIGSRWN